MDVPLRAWGDWAVNAAIGETPGPQVVLLILQHEGAGGVTVAGVYSSIERATAASGRIAAAAGDGLEAMYLTPPLTIDSDQFTTG